MKDLEYFKEFLEHPELFNHADFYEKINEWGNYVIAHKNDFDYLHDEEWKEIRERIKSEVRKRDAISPKLVDKYNRIVGEIHSIKPGFDIDRMIIVLRKLLSFMKKHQTLFRFSVEDITLIEEDLHWHLKEIDKLKANQEVMEENNRMLQKAVKNYNNMDADGGDLSIVPFKVNKKVSRN